MKKQNSFSLYRTLFRSFLFSLILSTIAACSGSHDEEPENEPNDSFPVAYAGENQNIESQTQVTLSGNGSDSDGTIVSYLWTETSNSNVSMTSPNQATINFIAPVTSTEITLEFLLTVTDNDNHAATDSIQIMVTAKATEPEVVEQMSEKRGLAYGSHSPDDLAIMQGKVKWWYNWSVAPENSVLNQYENYDFDFVPMVWDEGFNENALRDYLNNHPDVKYILGFNEPNFIEQANLTPAEAAALWPKIESIANDYNLEIVAPAVNYSPGQVDIPGTDDNSSPWAYLDAFFEACPNCQIDYIAVHSYMKYASAFEWYIGEFERYEIPIWVTEWASWDDGGPANVGEQMDYLASTVRWMENNPNVERYAWFIGRTDGGSENFPYLDILASDGQLTPLGSLYTGLPSVNYRYSIPGRIEAEGAHRLSGFRHEPTEDNSGNVNMGWAQPTNWLEFDIDVPVSKTYNFSIRVASDQDDKKLNILIDEQLIFTQNIFNTGDMQAWQTLTSEMSLEAGIHTLKLEAVTDGFNINWVEISEL